MRLITSNTLHPSGHRRGASTWPLLAGLALLCASFPFLAEVATGAPSSPLATPGPETNVKVHGRGGNEATPAPVTYSTLDGTWEVQGQAGGQTQYSHLFLLTSGDSISGTWQRQNGKVPKGKTPSGLTPIRGMQSSDRFTISGSDALGRFSLAGYIENDATMIGQLTEGRMTIPFTATHQGLPLNERPPKQRHQRHHHRRGAVNAESSASAAPPTAAP